MKFQLNSFHTETFVLDADLQTIKCIIVEEVRLKAAPGNKDTEAQLWKHVSGPFSLSAGSPLPPETKPFRTINQHVTFHIFQPCFPGCGDSLFYASKLGL